ncbi:MAG: hypothetical protein ACE5I1_28530 [bacterium]
MKILLSVRSSVVKNLLLFFSLLTLSACSSKQLVKTADELRAAYRNAIADAEVAEPNEISRDLVAIVSSNHHLVWNEESQKNRILAVTWTSWDGYDDKIGQEMELAREIWVTVVPELKNFCESTNFRIVEKQLRLEQLLGLPPENGKTKFVELWVYPGDLFRPSPDPEISDHEAELIYPVSERFLKVSEAHKNWFNDLKNKSYSENGYPWTRLGYTYDWGNPRGEIGLSEFVIRTGAVVAVHAVTPTEAYCKGK